jgi:hypothetical protein
MPRDGVIFDGLSSRPQLRIAEVMRNPVVLKVVQPVAHMVSVSSEVIKCVSVDWTLDQHS